MVYNGETSIISEKLLFKNTNMRFQIPYVIFIIICTSDGILSKMIRIMIKFHTSLHQNVNQSAFLYAFQGNLALIKVTSLRHLLASTGWVSMQIFKYKPLKYKSSMWQNILLCLQRSCLFAVAIGVVISCLLLPLISLKQRIEELQRNKNVLKTFTFDFFLWCLVLIKFL